MIGQDTTTAQPTSALTFIVVYQKGPHYTSPAEVIRLHHQVRERVPGAAFLCLTDCPEELPSDIPTKALLGSFPDWWCLIEAFRVPGPCVLVGMDTIVVGPLKELTAKTRALAPDEFMMMRPPRLKAQEAGFWSSGVMAWNGDMSWLCTHLKDNQDLINSKNYRMSSIPGRPFRLEQDYTTEQLKDRGYKILAVQDTQPGVYFFKQQIRGKPWPDDIELLVFQNDTRPDDVARRFDKVRDLL